VNICQEVEKTAKAPPHGVLLEPRRHEEHKESTKPKDEQRQNGFFASFFVPWSLGG
jgi:hypothetical protein